MIAMCNRVVSTGRRRDKTSQQGSNHQRFVKSETSDCSAKAKSPQKKKKKISVMTPAVDRFISPERNKGTMTCRL